MDLRASASPTAAFGLIRQISRQRQYIYVAQPQTGARMKAALKVILRQGRANRNNVLPISQWPDWPPKRCSAT